jgi:hypothetical protein
MEPEISMPFLNWTATEPGSDPNKSIALHRVDISFVKSVLIEISYL